MAYITEQDYKSYTGVDPPDDFFILAERASEQIDALTMYRIVRRGLDGYPEWVQGQIRKAVCAQLQYLDANGGLDALLGDNMASVSLGKFNYSTGQASNGAIQYAPMAEQYLAPTGLLYSGMEVME